MFIYIFLVIEQSLNTDTLIYAKNKIIYFLSHMASQIWENILTGKAKKRPYGRTLSHLFHGDLGLRLSLKPDEDPENAEAPRPSCPKPCLCWVTATHTSWLLLWTQTELCTQLSQLNFNVFFAQQEPRKANPGGWSPSVCTGGHQTGPQDSSANKDTEKRQTAAFQQGCPARMHRSAPSLYLFLLVSLAAAQKALERGASLRPALRWPT